MTEYILEKTNWPKSLPDAHRKLLHNMINTLSSRPDILGLAIGGSFIYGKMDDYSDLDLILVVDPKQWGTVEKTRQQIAESIGPLIIAFTGEHIGIPQMLICLYGTIPLHVDLKFIIPEQLSSRSEDPVILWDRNGELHSILASSKASPQAIDWQWIEDRLWVWIHYMTSRVGRGELFAAIDFLSFIREKVLGPIALHASSANPNGVRHFERDAGKYKDIMKSTLAGYDQQDIIRAIHSAISMYRSFRRYIAPRDLVRKSKAEKAAIRYFDSISKELIHVASRSEHRPARTTLEHT